MGFQSPPVSDEDLEDLGSPSPAEDKTQFEPYAYALVDGPDGLPMEDTPWEPSETAPIPLSPETLNCVPQPPSAYAPAGLPACRYYKRQRIHTSQAPDRPIVTRFCTCEHLRGINGAAMALGDAGTFECEMRDPPDPRATVVLDAIDARKMREGIKRMQEQRAGVVVGFRIFRNAEDVAKGRWTLDADDTTTVPLAKPKNMFEPDEAPVANPEPVEALVVTPDPEKS